MLQRVYGFRNQLDVNKKLMDLKDPNVPEDAQLEIAQVLENPNRGYHPKEFTEMYNEDQLGQSITNLPSWLMTNFHYLQSIK